MTVPVAAASAIYPLIAGPAAIGIVLGSFSRALVIGIEAPPGPVRNAVVSVLGPGAAAVPNGIRIPNGAMDFARHRPGDPVRIGDGTVRIAEIDLRMVRTWNSRVPRVRPEPDAIGTIEAIAVNGVQRGVPVGAISNLSDALSIDALSIDAVSIDAVSIDALSIDAVATGDRAIATAVAALVGLGQGLTPGGDDVLAGLLVGLHAGDQTALARTIGERALYRVFDRTTRLSADLLRLAADGHACVEVLALLRAVHTGDRVPAALDRLLSIGHTSGADLATGLGMGLRCGRSMSRYDEASTTTR